MKTLLLIFATALLTAFTLTAQDVVYEKVYFTNAEFENEHIKVVIDDVLSLPKETKFRMTITNKTTEYLIYNSEESNFEIPSQDVRAKEKSWLIEPMSTKKKVMRAFGEGLNNIREFNFVCEGFYRLVEQEPYTVDQFRLPPSANSFEAGPMYAVLKKENRATGGANLKMDVTNKGANYGFIYPYKVKVLMPDGNHYATTHTDMKPVIIERGATESFSASWNRMPGGRVNDMQKVEMLVEFEGVFLEAISEKIEGETINLTWNEALTQEKK